MKDSIGKAKTIKKFFPQKIITNNKKVTDTDVIAKKLNTYFTEIGQIFLKNLKYLQKLLTCTYENRILYNQKNPFTINELKDVFFLLKQVKVSVMMELVLMLSEPVSDC